MDRLCGPESLQVVLRRFSDGVDVLKCVAGFIKEVSEVEQSYSNSLHKLIKSPLYELHSNFIMQLLGSNPYEEIGTVKHTWSELGKQLSTLASLHADKAKEYMNEVRQPLLDLVPQLEEARKEVKSKARQLREELDAAASKHLRTKARYQQTADNVEKCWQKVSASKSDSLLTVNQKTYMKNNERLAVLEAELSYQELVYKDAQKKHLEVKESFDRQVKDLYEGVQAKEMERVGTIKKSLQKFAKTLSNTVPTYLEAMQHIVISMEQIDSSSDIEAFVGKHTSLMELQPVPPFEQHPISIRIEQTGPLSSVKAGSKHKHTSKLTGDEQANGTVAAGPLEKEDEEGLTAPEEQGAGVSGGHRATQAGRREPEERGGREPEGPSTSSPAEPVATALQGDQKKRVHPKKLAKPKKPEKPVGVKVQPTTPSTSSKPLSNGIPGRTAPEPHPQNSLSPSKGHAKELKSASKPEPTAQETVPTSGKPKLAAKPVTKPATVETRHSSKTGTVRTSEAQAREQRSHTDPSLKTSDSTGRQKLAQRLSQGDEEEQKLLSTLRVRARDNDYYAILRVDISASEEELSKARRERTRELHPDHFTNDEEQREIAQQELVLVNQAYQDVLVNSETRDLYNQLCGFRGKYHLILNQKARGLQNAHEKLSDLRKKLKKCRCPQSLLEELDAALNLIQTRINKLQDSPSADF